jgi:hemerythrin
MITLTKDMEVGVAKVDAQHKELVDRINKVTSAEEQSATKEETQKMLDYLGDYIVKHFGDEEILQRESKYPEYEWHKEQHKLYVDNFNKLKEEFKTKGPSMEFTMELNKSVIGWIVKHIKSVDVKFGKYYQERSI